MHVPVRWSPHTSPHPPHTPTGVMELSIPLGRQDQQETNPSVEKG